MRSLLLLLVLAACAKEKPLPVPPSGPGQCLADKVKELRLDMTNPGCHSQSSCRESCLEGSPGGCMVLGQVLQEAAKDEEATKAYARGCELGAANGCTNYAASLWKRAKPTDPEQACAERLFKQACEASDPFACGMVGRLMIEDLNPPKVDEAKTLLEASCEKLKGFPCRVLALHLEGGKLGSATPERIQELLARSCDGGDPDGCGKHATAASTFGAGAH